MEHKELKKNAPVELEDALLEAVAAGESIPPMEPPILYAHSSGMSSSTLIPTRDEEGNLIYITPPPWNDPRL